MSRDPVQHGMARAAEARLQARWSEVARVLDRVGAEVEHLPEEDPRRLRWTVASAEALQMVGGSGRARALAASAIRAADPEEHGALLAKAQRVLGTVTWSTGDLRGGRNLLERSLELSRRHHDQDTAVRCCVTLSNLALDQGQLDAAEALLEQGLEEAMGQPVLELLPLPALANIHQRRGDRDEARTRYASALDWARSRRHRLVEAMCLHGLANLALERQETAEAIEHVADAHRAYARCGYHFGEAQAFNVLGEAYRQAGDRRKAIRAYERAIRSADNVGHTSLLPRANLAVLKMETGRTDEARPLIEEVLGVAERRGMRPLVASMHALLLPCVADDEQRLTHHLARATDGLVETGIYDRDLAICARKAGEITHSEELAARCRALAMQQFLKLGDRDGAAGERRALRELARGGAPIPAGPFDLIEALGSGAMGEVWMARHRLGFDAAVKVVAAAANEERLLALLAEEARAVVGLDHPNVVRLIDYGSLGPSAAAMRPSLREGAPWLAMEVVRGGDLEALCGTVPWPDAKRLLLELLDALGHAHSRRVLHLDVKPANVLLTDDDTPRTKLVDFGLAAVLSLAGSRVRVAGTPLYMAPEQFRGEPRDWGPWTDLYALGCLAIHLVCGRPPYEGDELPVIRAAHLHDEPVIELPEGVPPGFADWVRKAIAKPPVDRFRFAADAAEELRFLDDEDHTVPIGRRVGEPASADRARSGLALFALRRPPLVGREAEQRDLWQALKPALRGRGPVVALLRGSSGVGKSALARWATERAHAQGMAHMLDDHRATADPIGALIADRLRVEGLGLDAAVDRITEREPHLSPGDTRALAGLGTGELPEGQSLDDAIRALLRLLERDCADRPVLLHVAASALEHPGLLTLAEALLETSLPVGLLLEVRPEEQSARRRGALVDGAVQVELGALDEARIRELLEAMLPLNAELGQALTERSAGNPRLALNLLSSLIRRDAVAVGAGGVVLRPGSRVEFPEDLQAAWRERLDEVLEWLGEDAALALTVAALLGAQVRMEDWRPACEAAEIGGLSRILRKLRQARLAIPTRDRGFVFAHPIVREVVLELARGRGLYEVACGAAAVAPSLADDAARRGELLADAGELDNAVPLLEQGANAALSQGEVLRARELLRRATDGLRALGVSPGDPAWARLDLVNCRICLEVGDTDTGEALAEQVLTLAQRARDEKLAADALRWIATFDWIGRRQALALEGFQDAREAYQDLDDGVGEARCLHGVAIIQRFEGDYGAASDTLEEALALCSDGSSPALEAALQTSLGDVRRRRRDWDGALEAFERGAALAREHEPTLLSTALLGLGELARKRGDLEAAERHYREALKRRRGGQRLKTASVLVNLGLLAMLRDRWEEAETLLSECIDLLDASERSTMVMWARIAMLPVAAQRKEPSWRAVLDPVEAALGADGMQDPDVAWCLETAGDRAWDSARDDRARFCWRWARHHWEALGEADRAAAVEARLAR